MTVDVHDAESGPNHFQNERNSEGARTGNQATVSPVLSRWMLELIERTREGAGANREAVPGRSLRTVSDGGDRSYR
ncbi:hypothetical protein [Natrinema salifodinae]|uniref:Uncharacterized protein n=1 Tax=Natrinema salifodinae TaxID=1202768 RepID=A0A1I0MG12_9EURY|nr:hypothetical protein [Natrinema salifodinae]SEV87347.1 hypothetical protein SAMN05216285_0930 [Natrinema salifodinae]